MLHRAVVSVILAFSNSMYRILRSLFNLSFLFNNYIYNMIIPCVHQTSFKTFDILQSLVFYHDSL